MNSTSKLYSELKPKAIELRRQGRTFTEICDELGHIPKATLSGWVKDIELTLDQSNRIKQIMKQAGHLGRHLGAQKNHQKRLNRLENIKREASLDYERRIKDPLFLAGLLLYLAEGTKKTEQFKFMNSDPKLMKTMMLWVMKNGDYNLGELRFRLYIHELYKNENCEDFWAHELGITSNQFLKTIYKPTGRLHKKNPSYKGCMRLEGVDSSLYWKTMAWRDCFYASISDSGLPW